jgi:hypothetical protein
VDRTDKDDKAMISKEVADRIREENILLRDEARRVCELAKRSGNRELYAHARSLEKLVKSHLSLVDGVLEAVSPDMFEHKPGPQEGSNSKDSEY